MALEVKDPRTESAALKDGAWDKLYRTYARGDNLNLTGITDYVDVANGMSFGYSPANRLAEIDGATGWTLREYIWLAH